jgi:2-polyprenyl-3-methyl-5-hydroxy-6-metoxy-1,4-benzoquinol methylase
MAIDVDPEGNETAALFALAELDGAEVLEIGCGDGRLTRRYAERAAHVTAIEPFEDSIARARERLRERPLPVEFRHATFEDFAARARPGVFDLVILSWSLC